MKKARNIALIIAVVFIAAGAAILGTAWHTGHFFTDEANAAPKEMHTINGFYDDIYISENKEDVIVLPSEDNKVTIEYYGEDFDITNANGKVSLQRHAEKSIGINVKPKLKQPTTVHIPTGSKANIYIYSASGDIIAGNMTLQNQMFLTTASSDIRAKNITDTTCLRCDTTSGEVYISNCSSPRISVNTVSGDVFMKDCETAENYDNYENMIDGDTGIIHIVTTSGDVYSEMAVCDTYSAETISGDIVADLIQAGHVFFLTVSGDVTSYLPYNYEDFRISTNTTSGDINVGVQPVETGKELSVFTISGDANVYFNNFGLEKASVWQKELLKKFVFDFALG